MHLQHLNLSPHQISVRSSQSQLRQSSVSTLHRQNAPAEPSRSIDEAWLKLRDRWPHDGCNLKASAGTLSRVPACASVTSLGAYWMVP